MEKRNKKIRKKEKEKKAARSIRCSSWYEPDTHQPWTLILFLVPINLWFVPECRGMLHAKFHFAAFSVLFDV
jgi:hypothetical protein